MDRMVRGGSSPLERMEKALEMRGFLVFGRLSRLVPVRVHLFSRENNAHVSAHLCRRGALAMSVQANREHWVVRWRDEHGQQCGRRFDSEDAAREFDETLGELAPKERRASRGRRSAGVYAYSTASGTRWYFKARGTAGMQVTRRGFTSERAARDAKRRLVERWSVARCATRACPLASISSGGWRMLHAEPPEWDRRKGRQQPLAAVDLIAPPRRRLQIRLAAPYAARISRNALAATCAGGQVSCNSPPPSTALRTPINSTPTTAPCSLYSTVCPSGVSKPCRPAASAPRHANT